MTPRQVQLVRLTFAEILPRAEQMAATFYERLFTLDSSVRPLFKSDLESQGKKLMASLALAVRGLDHPEQIATTVRQLGERHVEYGVQAQDYETAGAALMWALGQALGDVFTEEVEEAWAAAYALLADLMLQAAAEGEIARGL